MSNQKKTVGKELLLKLKEALSSGLQEDKDFIAENSERLINSAESYRKLRDDVKQVLRDMDKQKNITDRDTSFRRAIESLQSAVAAESDP